MSDEQKKKLAAECFRRGTEAMGKENWDYAIQMFGQSVTFDATNLMFRQTLRGVEEKKYRHNKTGAKMAGMKLMGVKTKISKARLTKDWKKLDQLAEEGLTVNPWDAQLNADLGDANKNQGDAIKKNDPDDAVAQDYYKIAIFGYDRAVKADLNNKKYLQTLAELFEERGEYDSASACWMRIVKLDPMDGEARKRATATSTMKVIDRGGYEGADSTKDAMADHEVTKRLNAAAAAGGADGPGMSEEADLQRACRKDPSKDNFLKLGDFLKRNGKLEASKDAFEEALKLSKNDQDIQEQVEDVEIELMQQELDTAKQAATENPDDEEATKKKSKLKNRVAKREREVLMHRVERYPTDLGLKFKLGILHRRFQEFEKAIPMLQQATKDHRHGVEALIALGSCFLSVKKLPLAVRQFEIAKDKIDPLDQPDLYKDCYYSLGRLAEKSGNTEAAEGYYVEVLGVDYEYKDARERLEGLQGGE